jgi:hypothetical protein
MHWIYGVYLFLSIVQLPVLLFMLALQKTTRCSIVRFDIDGFDIDGFDIDGFDIDGNNTATATVGVQDMAKESVCTAAMAVLFAVLYMVRTQTVDDTDDKTPLFKTMMRASFWCFVFFHGCVLHCGWPRPLTRNDIFATSALRTLALWGFCRLDDKRAALIGGSTLYMLWAIAYTKFYVSGSFVMVGVAMLMDALLALGHCYDDITTELVASNCRLCYVAISGWATIFWLPLLTG